MQQVGIIVKAGRIAGGNSVMLVCGTACGVVQIRAAVNSAVFLSVLCLQAHV
jgi:hypothetical protein